MAKGSNKKTSKVAEVVSGRWICRKIGETSFGKSAFRVVPLGETVLAATAGVGMSDNLSIPSHKALTASGFVAFSPTNVYCSSKASFHNAVGCVVIQNLNIIRHVSCINTFLQRT